MHQPYNSVMQPTTAPAASPVCTATHVSYALFIFSLPFLLGAYHRAHLYNAPRMPSGVGAWGWSLVSVGDDYC
jgi:hypothetical protein